MAPLRIAILGSGIFAKEAHLPAIKKVGASSIVLQGIYSRSEKSASGLAADAVDILGIPAKPPVYFDDSPNSNLDALLARSDVDAVLVVLPITTQPDIIRKAFAAGKHVISEKPVAKDVATALTLIKEYETTYKPKGIVWRVAENFEAETGYQVAAKAIADGKIGKVQNYGAVVVNYVDQESKWYKTPWRTTPDYQGGFLLDGGVHTLAALRVILPSPIKTVCGFASLSKSWLAPHDTIQSAVQSADGTHGLIEMSFGAPTPSRSKSAPGGLTFTGDAGWMFVSQVQVTDGGAPVGATRIAISTIKRDKDGKEVGEDTEVIDVPTDGVPQELSRFVKAVAGDDDGLGTPRGALQDVAYIQAALTSNGSPIDLVKLTQ